MSGNYNQAEGRQSVRKTFNYLSFLFRLHHRSDDIEALKRKSPEAILKRCSRFFAVKLSIIDWNDSAHFSLPVLLHNPMRLMTRLSLPVEAKKKAFKVALMLFDFPILFSFPNLHPRFRNASCTFLMCLTSEIDFDMNDGKLVFEFLMNFGFRREWNCHGLLILS
jgi:hypothetical protein